MIVEEPPRVFDHPTGRWLRTGGCSHCGECCAGEPSPELFTEAELRDRESPTHCPLLRFVDGRSECIGHGEHPFYFTGCDEHPRCPDDLAQTPSCTYKFEAV